MDNIRPLIVLALRVVAVAMAAASVTLITLKMASVQLHVVLLAFGLFTLSIAAIVKEYKNIV